MIQPASVHDLCGLIPHAKQYRATILETRELAAHTHVVRVACPEVAQQMIPGQFFMIRPDRGTDPMLGRPFALYDTILDENGTPVAFEFAYHVVGKMTKLMSQWQSGQNVEIWGPLGNGFPLFQGKHLLCVGGGIGYTPFFAVARETLRLRTYGTDTTRRPVDGSTPPKVSLFYGVQSKRFRADLTDLEALSGLNISISTDDGTEGHKGFVTSLIEEAFQSSDRPDGVYCCGPEPMMHAVARLCRNAGIPCWLSLETPMACGFGACFSCVTKVRDTSNEEGWDYRRTCVEGPIFPAEQLLID
ncbi:dihydroorotate dehydrogenase electron transfer subunit [Planctomicrobium sp. SH527]|uniref:dihydroorotate dehydrogenase electron transfer subunit n=1 Tax=Planctomicrobium sp. SH527 TaxID=3448123 RepID=UPI003F5BC192